MTDKVYVVIAEEGEYSDRNDWVAGVFTDKAEAERLVLEKSQERLAGLQAHGTWRARYLKAREVVRAEVRRLIAAKEPYAEKEAMLYSAEALAGPRPETADWDRLYLSEVPLNEWGKFEF